MRKIADLRARGIEVRDDVTKDEARRLKLVADARDKGIACDREMTTEELKTLLRDTYIQEIPAKVVGVSFRNRDRTSRQEIISRCHAGEPVLLNHEPTNRHDPNAVSVVRLSGEQLGYLSARFASEIVGWAGCGCMFAAFIAEITGGTVDKATLGVNLRIVHAGPGVSRERLERHLEVPDRQICSRPWQQSSGAAFIGRSVL